MVFEATVELDFLAGDGRFAEGRSAEKRSVEGYSALVESVMSGPCSTGCAVAGCETCCRAGTVHAWNSQAVGILQKLAAEPGPEHDGRRSRSHFARQELDPIAISSSRDSRWWRPQSQLRHISMNLFNAAGCFLVGVVAERSKNRASQTGWSLLLPCEPWARF